MVEDGNILTKEKLCERVTALGRSPIEVFHMISYITWHVTRIRSYSNKTYKIVTTQEDCCSYILVAVRFISADGGCALCMMDLLNQNYYFFLVIKHGCIT
jgi:hypothetical protein